MATNSHWTVIFEDKSIRNQSIGIAYEINDDVF